MELKGTNLNIGRYSILGDRASQQDSCDYVYLENRSLLLASVCDGMGGMAGGERASSTAISAIMGTFREKAPADLTGAPQWMTEMFIECDRLVSGLTKADGSPLGGGSTCLMVISDKTRFLWGCVGDSRIMLLRGGKLLTLTRMHNYYLRLNEMLSTGTIDKAEYQKEAVRGEALISYLGMGQLPLIDVPREPIAWADGDVLIICSDGLYKSLNDEQITAIVEESGGSMQLAAKRLCDEAFRLAKKKQDNTTVITVGYTRGEGM